MTDTEPLFCANHPDKPTTLRCNRCEKLICSKCARLTPIGYRCRDCLSGQQKIFETALLRDYLLAFPIAAILSFFASAIVAFVGFFVFLLAPVAGAIIAESVRFVVQKRRSTKLTLTVMAGVIVGCLPQVFGTLFRAAALAAMGEPEYALGGLPGVLWVVIYAAITVSTVYYRLKGINLKF